MLKSIAFMGGATMARLLSGAVLMVLIARALGPEDYGRFVFSFSMAMLATILLEFGHSNFLMRELGRGQRAKEQILREVFSGKLILSFCFMAVSLLVACLLIPVADHRLFLVLSVSGFCMTFGDTLNVAFRGIQQVRTESRNVVLASAAHLLIVAPVAWHTASATDVATAFAASRFLYVVLSFVAFKSVFEDVWSLPRTLGEVRDCAAQLKQSFAYAADGGLVSLRGYADVFLVNALLGSAALGTYQAGMNLVKAIENIGPTIANVYLPKLAAELDRPAALQKLARQLQLAMYACGLLAGAAFFLAPPVALNFLFGAKYAATFSLFKLFGLYLIARFVAVSLGVMVTVHGLHNVRTLTGFVALGVLVGCSLALVPRLGIAGASAAGIFCTQVVSVFFVMALERTKTSVVGKREFWVINICIFLATLYILMVH